MQSVSLAPNHKEAMEHNNEKRIPIYHARRIPSNALAV
jgi:hypothetical protein